MLNPEKLSDLNDGAKVVLDDGDGELNLCAEVAPNNVYSEIILNDEAGAALIDGAEVVLGSGAEVHALNDRVEVSLNDGAEVALNDGAEVALTLSVPVIQISIIYD